jgi:hypothetical protein
MTHHEKNHRKPIDQSAELVRELDLLPVDPLGRLNSLTRCRSQLGKIGGYRPHDWQLMGILHDITVWEPWGYFDLDPLFQTLNG